MNDIQRCIASLDLRLTPQLVKNRDYTHNAVGGYLVGLCRVVVGVIAGLQQLRISG